MATYTQSPIIKRQYLDNSGNPLNGGKLYTVAAGGSYPADAVTTYQTANGTAHTNPIILDSAGRIPGSSELFLEPGQSYKFILTTSADVSVWTQDLIAAVPPSTVNVDIQGTAGEDLAAGDVVYLSEGEGSLTPGSWYKTDSDLAYASSQAITVGMVPSSIANGAEGTIRLEGVMAVAGPLVPGSSYYVAATAGALTATAPANTRFVGQAQSTTEIVIVPNPVIDPSIVDTRIKTICNGRLTLTTGVAVTTADVTAATTVYWTPYHGNEIALFNGSGWVAFTQAQLSIAVPATTGSMYDVFVDYNAGTPALSVTVWTNVTTRATALTLQDGVLVLTGSTGKRYVGSFCTTSVSGQTEDSEANRMLWNYYNRVWRPLRKFESTASWTYTTSTWRQARATATNKVAFVQGVIEDPIHLTIQTVVQNSGAGGPAFVAAAIGLDSTTAPAAQQRAAVVQINAANEVVNNVGEYQAFVTAGYHDANWLERSEALGTTTWYSNDGIGTGFGVQSGIIGGIFG